LTGDACAAEAHDTATKEELESRLLALELELAVQARRHVLEDTELRALFAAKLVSEEAAAKQVLAEKVNDLQVLEQMVSVRDAELRKLRDDVQTLKGNVRVMVRVRPYLPHEVPHLRPEEESWVRTDPDHKTVRVMEESSGGIETSHTFSFDRAFGQSEGQADVFAEVSAFVQSAIDGFNVCLFSYGQTGSGKTHTMSGAPAGDGRGIIPRAMEQLAAQMVELKKTGSSFVMTISLIEIYCENIRDLLIDGIPDKKIVIQTDKVTGQNIVKNVVEVEMDPSDPDSIAEVLQRGSRKQTKKATKMNSESSRGHTILIVRITATTPQGTTVSGLLYLVDLAGSERTEKSGVVGQALTEANSINTSLAALSATFLELRNKSSFVNFRNSNLTLALQPVLRGNAKVLMMLNLSPLEASTEESISSLRFGDSVSSCELGLARRNGSDAKQGAVRKSLARRSISPSRVISPSKRGATSPKK
jgi:kinesin family protein C1